MSALAYRTVPRLCDDLVPHILEQNEDRWWPRDFQALALVSPAWLQPVRRRLYANPTVRSFAQCIKLARTLRDNPTLLDLLHGLDLRPLASAPDCAAADDDDGHAGGHGEAMAALRFILGAQRAAARVVLAGDLAVRAERFLHALAAPWAVVELHVDGHALAGWDRDGDGCAGWHAPSLRWDPALATTFPGLRKLRLCNLELETTPPPPGAVRVALDELVLDDVRLASAASDVRHVADLSRLRALAVSSASAADLDAHLPLLVTACSDTLERLVYDVAADDARGGGAVLLADFAPCPRLRALSLAGVPLAPEALALLASHCPSLEALAVAGRGVPIAAADWAAFVRAGALPRLAQLGTPCGTCAPPFARWTADEAADVVDACQARGISLLCMLGQRR